MHTDPPWARDGNCYLKKKKLFEQALDDMDLNYYFFFIFFLKWRGRGIGFSWGGDEEGEEGERMGGDGREGVVKLSFNF